MRIDTATRARARPSLTPLIDVIFLLLMFFMLTTSFMRFSELDLAATGEAAAGGGGVPGLLIRLEGDRGLRLNGEPLSLAELPARLQVLAGRGATSATVQAGEDADTQALVDLMEVLRASPVNRVTLQP